MDPYDFIKVGLYCQKVDELLAVYPDDKDYEYCEELNILSLYDTPSTVGTASISDILVLYDSDGYPNVVTERIYRGNYEHDEWDDLTRTILSRVKTGELEFGFYLSITVTSDYIDYIHYKDGLK